LLVFLGAAVAERDRAIGVREEFIQVASHELRTPITALKLALQSVARILRKGQLERRPSDPRGYTPTLRSRREQAAERHGLAHRPAGIETALTVRTSASWIRPELAVPGGAQRIGRTWFTEPLARRQ